ncbi:hypothetical protein GGF44_001355 [Coemansia sp. RSA 1694]|nr:hypothetical protein GGF44_001355 [Coemansia sp. RSA 1694]
MAQQVVARLKQNGTFDTMRQEMLASFLASARSTEFDDKVREILEREYADVSTMRGPELTRILERRLVSSLERQGVLAHLERDARNFWLSGERSAATKQKITLAIGDAQASGAAASIASLVDVDPPRIAGSGTRTHNYYRRGDAVVAFIALGSALCSPLAQYVCVAAEVAACDARRNMYTVRDPDADADAGSAAQNTWVVYWDQLLAIKRPYECTYHAGDQVYALFREDAGGDTAVSTEFFPARVHSVGALSLAVRFDAGGALCHVYYDEVFAAGRVGFLRARSAERRRRGDGGAVVETPQGKEVPSFTGFWPAEAEPRLGKHGRKVRYRQKPPLLVAQPQAKTAGEPLAASSPGSDMDIDNSSPEPPPSPPPQLPPAGAAAAPTPVSEEDGEIGAEDGECASDRASRRARIAYDRRSRWDQRSPVRRDDHWDDRRDDRWDDHWDDRSRSRFDSRAPHRSEYRRPRRSRSRSSSPRMRHAYRR